MKYFENELQQLRSSAVKSLDDWQGIVDVGAKGSVHIKAGSELGYRHDTLIALIVIGELLSTISQQLNKKE